MDTVGLWRAGWQNAGGSLWSTNIPSNRIVTLNIVFSLLRLQNLPKRHNLSVLCIITRCVLVRFIAVWFSLKNRGMEYGWWFKTAKDWDETRILHEPILSHAAFFQVCIYIRRDKRSSEPKRWGWTAHKKPLIPKVKRYPVNMAGNNI